MKKMIMVTLMQFLILASATAFADGIELQSKIKLGANELILNGSGIRKATIFKVKVYQAGLYLKAKNTQDQSILKDDSDKLMKLIFLRDISGDKIRNAFKEGYEHNCLKPCEPSDLNALLDSMVEFKKNDVVDFWIKKDSVQFSQNQKTMNELKRTGIGSRFLSIWLGANPPTEELKEGLLGR